MITIVLTNRNREQRIIKNCLESLAKQSFIEFNVILVDYGSNTPFVDVLIQLVSQYHFVEMICCRVQGQLWNKSKAINIALQKTTAPYFFVGDIDMLFRHDFVEKLHTLKKEQEVIYFQVGVLCQSESVLDKSFEDYTVKHKTNNEATGMTLYPTKLLRKINGYDEFYHGWGAEDTDVHIRLRHAGYNVYFYDESLLLLHQWHPKFYRSKESKEPFHSRLEQINHQYIQCVAQQKKSLANTVFGWGVIPKTVDFSVQDTIMHSLTNQVSEVEALLYGFLDYYKGRYVCVKIQPDPKHNSFKNTLKKCIGKKYLVFYDFQTINDLVLGQIVTRFRDKYYTYEWDKETNIIVLKIAL